MGAIGTRLSLRPLFSERAMTRQQLGRVSSRDSNLSSAPSGARQVPI